MTAAAAAKKKKKKKTVKKVATVGVSTKASSKKESITIPAPKFETICLDIRGTSPLVIKRFSKKTGDQLLQAQIEGGKSKNKKKLDPRDIEEDFQEARHISTEGWDGIPASAFRSACIRACQLVGINMTMGKMSVFVVADGYSREEGTPLIKIISKKKPEASQALVRIGQGTPYVTIRPMWKEWAAKVRVRFDGDQFGAEDVANLMMRAGLQVGICEGRPFSKKSDGCGWGTFEVV